MFERFTERARQVVVLAQDEARRLKHNYIGTEHLLLGLLREEEGLAARVLGSFGLTVEGIRAQVARIVGHGDELSTGQIPFTPRAKKILELSLREALSLQHHYIGTEHLLLGLVRENEGVAARIMLDYGASAEAVRAELIRMLSGWRAPESTPPLPETLPDADEVAAELERVRADQKEALEAEEFERAARLQGRERMLMHAATLLGDTWAGRDVPGVGFFPAEPLPGLTEGFIGLPEHAEVTDRGWLAGATPALAAGATIFVAGLVAGRLIWG